MAVQLCGQVAILLYPVNRDDHRYNGYAIFATNRELSLDKFSNKSEQITCNRIENSIADVHWKCLCMADSRVCVPLRFGEQHSESRHA